MSKVLPEDERFDEAVTLVLSQEGGYDNDKADKGEKTKYGISERSYPNIDILNLTIDEAKAIYRQDFWEKPHYNKIQDCALSIKMFDMAVNIGVYQANCLLQQALRAKGKNINLDGVLGPLTLSAVNVSNPLFLIDALKSENAKYYKTLVAIHSDESKFLKGWLTRDRSSHYRIIF